MLQIRIYRSNRKRFKKISCYLQALGTISIWFMTKSKNISCSCTFNVLTGSVTDCCFYIRIPKGQVVIHTVNGESKTSWKSSCFIDGTIFSSYYLHLSYIIGALKAFFYFSQAWIIRESKTIFDNKNLINFRDNNFSSLILTQHINTLLNTY